MAKKNVNVTVDYKVKGGKDVNNAFDGISESANEASTAVDKTNSAMEDTGSSAKKAKSGLGGVLDGFKAIVANPVGATIAALVVAFKFISSAISGSEESSNSLAQGFSYLEGFILPLQKSIRVAFDAIGKAIASPGETWDALLEKIESGVLYYKDNIIMPYLNVWKLMGLGIAKVLLTLKLKIAEFFGKDDAAEVARKQLKVVDDSIDESKKVIADAAKTIKDDVVDAVDAVVDTVKTYADEADKLGDKLADLTRREQELVKVRRQQSIENAKAIADIEKLKVVRDNEANALEDKIAANEEIGRIEKERVASATSLANQELALIRATMKERGDSTELLDAEADKQLELQELRSENAGIETEQANAKTALLTESFEKRASLIDRELEFNAILEEDAVKLADARIKAEQDKLNVLTNLGLQEKQTFIDQQTALKLAQQEGIKARLDADKEAADELESLRVSDNKKQEKDAKELAKLKLDVEKDVTDQTLNFANSLSSALGENSKEALIIQKTVALAQIGVDTAKAISSLTANSQGNPANAVTFGGAGIAQFAAGILQIGANMAQAYTLLKQPAPQIDGGGDAGGSAPQTQQTSPADISFRGQSAGAEQFGAQTTIRAYVTESDITTSQNNANSIQQLSQIG